MKVAIKLMNMSSKPGYVPSSGWTEAILVTAEAAADCCGFTDALWELEGTNIKKDNLQDVKLTTHTQGVCHYRTISGSFDVPDGMAVVQNELISISTRDQVYRHSWVVAEESLVVLYRERSVMYEKLAEKASRY